MHREGLWVAGRSAEELRRDCLVGAALLGAAANVIMQLSRPAVGHGVVESTVDSGKLLLHPIKRTRTTVSYLAVALVGTDSERRLYRRAVDRSHAPVRSTATSPVTYSAVDPDLQLWVAACLYRGIEDSYRMFVGSLDEEDAETLYRGCARLGTTLQMSRECWPVDRAAFERYWAEALSAVRIDDAVREYLETLMRLRFLPRPLSLLFGPIHGFITTGYLPPTFREAMQLRWSSSQQRRFDRVIACVARLVRLVPGPVRRFPYNAFLRDVRRRLATNRPLV
jgi:uncharacterized protein (DUF2236 family)